MISNATAPNFLLARGRLKPDWMERWIIDPQAISPGTSMPSGLFKRENDHWVFSGPTPPSFQGYDKDHTRLLVDYILQLTPEEQRRVAGAMGRNQASSNRTSPDASRSTKPAGGSARDVAAFSREQATCGDGRRAVEYEQKISFQFQERCREIMNRKHMGSSLGLCAVVGLVLLTGCSKKSNEEQSAAPSTAAAPAPAATPIDPATAASVSGTVSFDGAAPKAAKIDMSQDPACKGMNMAENVVADGGKLANVFVYVKDGLGSRTFDVPKDAVTH